MNIQDICDLYGVSPQVEALKTVLEDKSARNVFLEGLLGSSAPMLFASVAKQTKKSLLFILQDADEMGYFYQDLCQFLGESEVQLFPSSFRRAAKYNQRDAANEILRTEVLSKLASKRRKPYYIVTSADALAEKVVEQQTIETHLILLKENQQIDMHELTERMRELGFQEVDYVYEPGQFASRGSIIDVFSYSSEYPFRIDFFGDDIDSIRTFSVQDQLSRERLTEIRILPELNSVAETQTSLLALLPASTSLVVRDFSFVRDTIGRIYNEGFSQQALHDQLKDATEMERAAIERQMRSETTLLTASQFAHDAERFQLVEIGHQPQQTPNASIKFDISPQPLFHKNFTLLRESLTHFQEQGYKIYLLADSKKQQQRLKDILTETDAIANREQHTDIHTADAFIAVDHVIHEGFADNKLKLCFFTDHQIFDRFHKFQSRSDIARAGKIAITMKELQAMEVGDYLVHVDHGIGKFGGLVRVPTGNSYQEKIRLIYQRGDIVDVSIHSLYKISKYRSSDATEPPRLSTLGTGAWERMKERTKKKIKDIARDLIKLYAKRRQEKGFAYSADSYMQHELEASFLYEDTPDQLKATNDVKADMESDRPMDRLICGDVGFGKTEVAIRAAFKAATDSKQVAVLVPTTILALQHYHTFSERLENFPVRVDYLSRARSAKQTTQILDDLKQGKIDILIGTHKILGKQVAWHDLGLLIIDEEQKFGVAMKEKLRKLRTNIDTLTMSATPIPRTLQFSLMGARDMSIIRTAPPNRYPIYTELGTFNGELIANAINYEMSRNGQVFFVNNRINSLPEVAAVIKKYVPDCRIGIAHGQMKPEEMEKIVLGFINYDYDVLLSTSIIENGIDIPNANTIIINDAHRFGLSDLHQMRGRVGRSNKKAFCYLLSPPKSVLTPEARRRLEALESFSELGSGFNLAMQDLDIRGAGNLLGAEQSGFIADLGYETYQKILSQAVTELKNDEFSSLYTTEMQAGKTFSGEEFVEDCSIESDLEMYFPDSYVPGSAERMLLYRQLDNISSDEALEAYRKQLEDRFGSIPHEGEELLQVVPLRRLGRYLGCEKIALRQQRMILQFVSNPNSAYYQSDIFAKILDFIGKNPRRCQLKEVSGRRLLHINQVTSVSDAVLILRTICSSSAS